MIFKNLISTKISKNERETKDMSDRYTQFKQISEKKVEQNKKALEELEDDWLYLKNLYNTVLKEQRSYYVDMLQKGIDTR